MARQVYEKKSKQRNQIFLFTLKEEQSIFYSIGLLLMYLQRFTAGECRTIQSVIHVLIENKNYLYPETLDYLTDIFEKYRVRIPDIKGYDNSRKSFHGAYYKIKNHNCYDIFLSNRMKAYEHALRMNDLTHNKLFSELDRIIENDESNKNVKVKEPIDTSEMSDVEFDFFMMYQRFKEFEDHKNTNLMNIQEESEEFVSRKIKEILQNA